MFGRLSSIPLAGPSGSCSTARCTYPLKICASHPGAQIRARACPLQRFGSSDPGWPARCHNGRKHSDADRTSTVVQNFNSHAVRSIGARSKWSQIWLQDQELRIGGATHGIGSISGLICLPHGPWVGVNPATAPYKNRYPWVPFRLPSRKPLDRWRSPWL